ncbi:MAG: RNA polymerase sigma-70 factor [Bacteroidales bacterium]
MASDDDVRILLNVALLEKFFRRHYENFCLLAYRYLHDRDMAEEVVQDVFVKIWEKRNLIEIKGSLTAYFNMAIKNTCLNFLKHKRVEVVFAQNYLQQQKDEVSPLDNSDELTEKIKQAIDSLPPQRKKIFLMSRNDGLKYQQIADKLQLSVKTVEAQMGLALKQLREQLREYLE